MTDDGKVKMLRIGQVANRYCITEYLIRRGVETGHFPAPVIVGARTRLWEPAELDAYFHRNPPDALRALVASARVQRRGRKTHPTHES
jgi:hypothetical protein